MSADLKTGNEQNTVCPDGRNGTGEDLKNGGTRDEAAALRICGLSVRGYSHIRSHKECQDYMGICRLPGGKAVLAAADGHGSEGSPYSSAGSAIAVSTFTSVMREVIESAGGSEEQLATYLHREGNTSVARSVENEWKRRIRKYHLRHHRSHKIEGPESLYRLYGTTILGLVLTERYLFAFQIGDGDIIQVDSGTAVHLVRGEKMLGVETHSLCLGQAWKYAVCAVRKREEAANGPLYMISTDGFANSYPDSDAFLAACRDYYETIHAHGFDAASRNLEEWLNQTSRQGCGDDITLILAM